MTFELMPRLGGARTWKDDEKLECVSVAPDGPAVVSFWFRSPSGPSSSGTPAASFGRPCPAPSPLAPRGYYLS